MDLNDPDVRSFYEETIRKELRASAPKYLAWFCFAVLVGSGLVTWIATTWMEGRAAASATKQLTDSYTDFIEVVTASFSGSSGKVSDALAGANLALGKAQSAEARVGQLERDLRAKVNGLNVSSEFARALSQSEEAVGAALKEFFDGQGDQFLERFRGPPGPRGEPGPMGADASEVFDHLDVVFEYAREAKSAEDWKKDVRNYGISKNLGDD